MSDFSVHQQKHGYRNGHQLLEGTIRLDRPDQEMIDRLSDLSGPIRPGELIPPYLTIYPLPSRAFHVVARTWPDLNAPRAGCVLTRSLLVPKQLWNENVHLQWLLEELTLPAASELRTFEYDPIAVPLPSISDPRTLELVEALFLESRKPIVVFDAKEADLLATRLLTAVWPAFRSEFSVCTYALGPRKIGGRDFDLVFAPKGARSRFSAWVGRKIDVGAPRTARHRWSQAVADAVFLSPDPTLASGDALGLLGLDGPGDEGAFRKSLLWNELAEKAPRNPSAVLGMIDIVNSQPGLVSNAMKGSQQLLISAIRSAVDETRPADAWSFLQTLEGKIQGRDDLLVLRQEAASDAARLAAADPGSAVEFAAGYEYETGVSSDLMRGVADGLGSAVDRAPVDFKRIPPTIGAFMIANSPSFSAAVAHMIRTGRKPASDVLAYFERRDDVFNEKAAARLVNEIDSVEFAPLLGSILRASSEEHLAGRILEIIRQTSLEFPEFDDTLIGAIPDDTALQVVRKTVADEVKSHSADRFLAKTIRLTTADVDWLYASTIERARASAMLSAAVAGHNDQSLIRVFENRSVVGKILDILVGDVGIAAPQIARVLILGPVSMQHLFEFGPRVIEALPESQLRSSLVSLLVKYALSEADTADDRVEALISQHFDEVGARQVMSWSTADGLSTARVATNLKILVGLPIERQKQVVSFVENLADDLSRRGAYGLDEEVCAAWAHLLWEARLVSPIAHLKAATKSMAALIYLNKSPVSEVIAASFPSVYRELTSRPKSDSNGVFGLLFALPLMLVSDWDRAKPARHALVDAFMDSSWHPSYLLLAGARAGILDRICLRVTRQKGGGKYLKQAIADLDRLAPEQSASIRDELSELESSDMRDEWD